jgi:dUTP pyrophosphatase
MGEDEYLQLANRSSNPLKRFITLSNGIGVIDSDYYNNPDNEGHIMFQFSNFGLTDITIKKGERIGQGIFLPFLKADNDDADTERKGGFGSSGKQ